MSLSFSKSLILCMTLLFGLSNSVIAEESAPEDGPDITIIEGTDKTIHEYRNNGYLYAIKIIPKNGTPYYLVRTQGGGFSHSDQPELLIPSWKIFEW